MANLQITYIEVKAIMFTRWMAFQTGICDIVAGRRGISLRNTYEVIPDCTAQCAWSTGNTLSSQSDWPPPISSARHTEQ